jgi:N-acetyl-anhydromuramyl-L-alanine amidase AmpD
MRVIETKLNFKNELTKRSKTDYIVLHHADKTKCTIYDIHQWHLNNGWAGCGYHFFISKDGKVYRGRPIDAVGAHCEGHNSNSIGICAEGNYHPSSNKPFDTAMPQAQKEAIIELLLELKRKYPKAQIVGHRDLYPTSCPGKYYPFNEILQAIKTQKEDGDVTLTKVIYKGKELDGFIKDGTTYVEVRKLCEAFGKKVTWNEQKKIVEVKD